MLQKMCLVMSGCRMRLLIKDPALFFTKNEFHWNYAKI